MLMATSSQHLNKNLRFSLSRPDRQTPLPNKKTTHMYKYTELSELSSYLNWHQRDTEEIEIFKRIVITYQFFISSFHSPCLSSPSKEHFCR